MSPLGRRGFPLPEIRLFLPLVLAINWTNSSACWNPFSVYWYQILIFIYGNPFCIKILLIKDQTFSLIERKCPVTYNKKNNFLWDLNDRQQSSTGSELNQVTVSKECQFPQTMPVFICRSSIHVCFSFAYWCSFSFLIYTFADKLRLSSAKYDF